MPIPIVLFIVAIDIVVFVGLAASNELTAAVVAVTTGVTILIAAAVLLFARLVVEVDSAFLRTSFGFGWPSRAIAIGDITAIRRVRNSWWYGWGIRWVGNGWMYNTWGYDAVEVGLPTGRVFRAGTDDPEGLATALSRATGLPIEPTPG